MIVVNIHEAKTQLSRLIAAVLNGEEVVIAKRNRPVARLVPHQPIKADRTPGWGGAGSMWMADDFDEPVEDFAEYV